MPILILSLSLNTAKAQWLQTDGSMEENVLSTFVDESDINPSNVIGYHLPARQTRSTESFGRADVGLADQAGLPARTQVPLKVYNSLGQEVGVLVDEMQQAGFKSVRWEASKFASGIYYYRIQTNEFVKARKLVLLR